MKLLIIFFCSSISFAAEWVTGDFKVNLEQDANGDWATQKCLTSCQIDYAAEKSLRDKALSADELSGGKNPGSVLCHRIEGKVLYLENKGVTQTFCSTEGEIISLSRLVRKVLLR